MSLVLKIPSKETNSLQLVLGLVSVIWESPLCDIRLFICQVMERMSFTPFVNLVVFVDVSCLRASDLTSNFGFEAGKEDQGSETNRS